MFPIGLHAHGRHRSGALRHHGQPAEIGHAAVFLAGDETADITGQALLIDGRTLPETARDA
jgi:NAD(P)-dependent dehydrogenase (short-subunit alcohol dehydrogenase family)